MIEFFKKLLNNDSGSEEVISKKDKYEEIHVQCETLEICLDLAEKRAATFPSNKVKINEYKWHSGVVRGAKVIPFIDTDNDGNPSKVYIYKIIKQN